MYRYEVWTNTDQSTKRLFRLANRGGLASLILFYTDPFPDFLDDGNMYYTYHTCFDGHKVIFQNSVADNPDGNHRIVRLHYPDVIYCSGSMALDHDGNLFIGVDGEHKRASKAFNFLGTYFRYDMLNKTEYAQNELFWFQDRNVQVALMNPDMEFIAGKFYSLEKIDKLFDPDIRHESVSR